MEYLAETLVQAKEALVAFMVATIDLLQSLFTSGAQ